LIPDHGIRVVLNDPLVIIRVWDGGMSSHGGILGIVIVSWFYARKHKTSWLGLGDGICVVAPIGLFFGRVANFINGELYGRIAEGVSWAVKFPDALRNPRAEESARFGDAAQAAAAADPSLVPSYSAMQLGENWAAPTDFFNQMLAAGRDNPQVNEAIAPFLEPRHPSQLYEGLLEGLLLFVILIGLRLRFPKLPNGVLTGLFFILYAVFRISMEEYRLPDSKLMAFDLTKGQFLSLFMVVAGAGFIGAGLLKWRRRAGVA
jgi:phosphatidylglycerol:prolipoprotein diacylglycerol transferase